MLLRTNEPYIAGIPRRMRTVFSYDISSSKRSRQVRRCLSSWRVDTQFSVFETFLLPRERYDVIADLHDLFCAEEDSLIVWSPYASSRWDWDNGQLSVDMQNGSLKVPPNAALPCGHYIITYDVRDEERLDCVHKTVRRDCIALQRSVYWYRGTAGDAIALSNRIGTLLADSDRLWVFPLARATELWFVVGNRPSILPTGRLPLF